LQVIVELYATAIDKRIMENIGHTKAGESVHLFRLKNESGMEAEISTLGGIVTRLIVPDRQGVFADVVLGYNQVAEYENDSAYLGALIGRYGNRIAEGSFSLNGTTYKLATNSTANGVDCHLHGGKVGFNQKVWNGESVQAGTSTGVKLSLESPDGEEGYPGNLNVTVYYWLHANNALEITYSATTDKATPVSLTNHSYFNLKGEGQADVLAHKLQIDAESYTPVTPALIPTGEIASLTDTPLDFRTEHTIGERLEANHPQLQFAGGYDHNYVLKTTTGKPERVAQVTEPESGRTMEVWTDAPGVQFYCGNFLDGEAVGKSGQPYLKRGGFCLETQHFPDAPNQPNFPSSILSPETTYTTTTTYKFGIN
jgi:aldose 1-epimerase